MSTWAAIKASKTIAIMAHCITHWDWSYPAKWRTRTVLSGLTELCSIVCPWCLRQTSTSRWWMSRKKSDSQPRGRTLYQSATFAEQGPENHVWKEVKQLLHLLSSLSHEDDWDDLMIKSRRSCSLASGPAGSSSPICFALFTFYHPFSSGDTSENQSPVPNRAPNTIELIKNERNIHFGAACWAAGIWLSVHL